MADIDTLQTLNNLARTMLHRMLKGLNDEQVCYSAPAIDGRSIAGIVVHAYSGAFRLAHVFAGKERPAIPAEPATAADLLALLDSMHQQVDQLLADLPDGALEMKYTMPWGQEWGGRDAFMGALAHTFVHVGNIQGIRAMGGFPTPPES